MTDTTQDRYTLTLEDGTKWTYEGTQICPWTAENGFVRFGPHRGEGTKLDRLTASELRRAADIVERWEQDHVPQTRRRVTSSPTAMFRSDEGGHFTQWAPHQSAERVRSGEGTSFSCDIITAQDLDALLSLRAHPYEVSHDGGATWTPCATEEGR